MELEPVFAALRGINQGTAATIVLAQAEGQSRRARASLVIRRAVATISDASSSARAEAAADQLADVADERRDLLDAARQRVTAIREHAERGMQPAVAELVRRVLAVGDTAGSAS